MAESRVLTNIPYTTHNYSNYDIVTEETRDIVDVPYFPAQNLVDVSRKLNLYNPIADVYVPFIDDYGHERLFALLFRKDARYLFVEFADNARYLSYAFSGNSFPQGREDTSYTYDGHNFYLFGGFSDGRCMNDMWEYDLNSNSWRMVNFSNVEITANEAPTRRRKASILKTPSKLYLFGGETDVLSINTANTDSFIVPLNDIWVYDFNYETWTNFDKNREIPHRPGNIIYADSAVIKIIVKGGINEIGINEPTAIWTIDIATDDVTSQVFSPPFTPSSNNVCLLVDGNYCILTDGGDLYRWDNTNGSFHLEKSNATAVNPITKHYWKINIVEKDYGNNSTMGHTDIQIAEEYQWDDTLVSTRDINLIPKGVSISSINVGNLQTFFYGGMIDNQHFNESTYIYNHTTRSVEKLDFVPEERPTERVFSSFAYDKFRGRVWLFGGFDGSKYYNDLWYFDLGLKKYFKVHDQLENTDVDNPKYPQPRWKAGMAVVAEDYLYVIGGYSDVRAFNDFWMYHIPTGEWKKEYPVDDIPWGSQYFIFEWRDRLWFYNGQKLYRYFYKIKQFVDQPFLIPDIYTDNSTNHKTIVDVIQSKEYLDPPIDVTVTNDALFVQNISSGKGYTFRVDLESRVLMDLNFDFDFDEKVLWMDRYYGVGVGSLSDYYINVSLLYPLTKNQIPNSYFHRETDEMPLNALWFQDYSVVSGENKESYMDNAGIFRIQKETIKLDKAELLVDREISVAGTNEWVPNVNFDDPDDVWNATIDVITKPTSYVYTPWFLYQKYLPPGFPYKGAQKVVYNSSAKRIYIIYKNGNTVKYNPFDNTFFTYFSKIWEGTAIGYNEKINKIYAFGGLKNDRKVYMQSGVEWNPVVIGQKNGQGFSAVGTKEEQSHCGLMEFDLNMNEMNLGSIEGYLREKKVASVDYSVTKEYLTEIVRHYIEGYSQNIIPNSLDDIKQKIYQATQPIVDDLSQFDFAFENGTRPLSKAYTLSTQIGSKLYIFGGGQCYTVECTPEIANTPYWVCKPGALQNEAADDHDDSTPPPYNPDVEARRAYEFDMDTRTWKELSLLPEWLYAGTAIPSPDNRYIYLVGGYTVEDCGSPSDKIYVYDTYTDRYSEIKGIPSTYAGRALPVLKWIDDEHLMIQFGCRTHTVCESGDGCTFCHHVHIPIRDTWIMDTRNFLFYKAFEDISTFTGMLVKDSFYVGDERDESKVWIMSTSPIEDNNGNPTLIVYEWNLVNGDVDVLPVIPSNEIINDYNMFSFMDDESKADSLFEDGGGTSTKDLLMFSALKSNFRFRYAWSEEYGTYNHKHLFIVGERAEKSGIEFIEEIARGHKEAHLRFWYVDMEVPANGRVMVNVTYEYPLPISPVCIAYDGDKYLYVIYNKYNIWRLNFKKVLEDVNGNWWYQLPPCMDCNFLGDDRTDDAWQSFFTPPKYLTLVSQDGKYARMDAETFTWFLDKKDPPEPPLPKMKLKAASGVDQNEIYMYQLGSIAGKVMNVYERQWDNFYFDMTITNDVVKNFQAVIDKNLWPTIIRRRRLYTINSFGHVFYAWLRIEGKFDVEYQLNDFYQGDEVRIYGDYAFLQQWDNAKVSVFTINNGWVEIDQSNLTPITNETGWDWDSNFMRRYRREFVGATGDIQVQYSKVPPNYLSVDLDSAIGDVPISKIRVFFQNDPKPYNYMSHINRVELITNQVIMAAYDDPNSASPLTIVHIEPLSPEQDYSNEFAIYVRNDGSDTAREVQTYVMNNEWVQFTKDPNDQTSWTIRDENHPFWLEDELLPGTVTRFYVRAVNIDMRPHLKDLVVKAIYPFS